MAANVTAGREAKYAGPLYERKGEVKGEGLGSAAAHGPLIFCMLPKKMGQLNDDEGGRGEGDFF